MSLINQLIGPVTGLLDKFVEDKDQINGYQMQTPSRKSHTKLQQCLSATRRKSALLRLSSIPKKQKAAHFSEIGDPLQAGFVSLALQSIS